jgi:RND family efflux transporter MFP subunit
MNLTQPVKKWIVFLLITTVCGVGAMTLYAMKPAPKEQSVKAPSLKRVTVQHTASGSYPYKVKGYGEVTAKWTTILRTRIGGRIVFISEHLQPGHRLKTGETILELDRVDYQVALDQAILEYEDARVNLIQVERQTDQAIADWKSSGIKQPPTSPLVFHGPQLKAAQARVTYAQSAVAKARNDLEQTRIQAPYNGLITERFTNKGETLFSGDQVLKLVSTDQLEIRVKLDASQVRRLGNMMGRFVEIRDEATQGSWSGKVVRDSGILDRKTRLRQFYIAPLTHGENDKKAALLPGMFITAVIHGKSFDNLICVPESSLTREGDIWIVDREDKLQRQKVAATFFEGGNAFIENPLELSSFRVATAPAPGFVSGTRISPVSPKGI